MILSQSIRPREMSPGVEPRVMAPQEKYLAIFAERSPTREEIEEFFGNGAAAAQVRQQYGIKELGA